VFAEVGKARGVTDHLVDTDGSGGVVIGETDDIKGLYRMATACDEFVDFETHIALTAEQDVPEVAAVVTSSRRPATAGPLTVGGPVGGVMGPAPPLHLVGPPVPVGDPAPVDSAPAVDIGVPRR
jgi:hypothetical protein